MARQQIRNPMDDSNLNNLNHNFTELYKNVSDTGKRIDGVVDEISDKALDKVVDNAKLNWKEPVNSFSDLPQSAQKGDTIMTKDTGKVYRFDGTKWIEIQQIDAGPVNELDDRLTTQLAEKANKSQVNQLEFNKADKGEVIDLLGNVSNGTPLIASNIEEMTDTTRLYVNTSDGYIYVHDGSEFIQTSVKYQSEGIGNKSIKEDKLSFDPAKKKRGKNLFNRDSAIPGKYIQAGTGEVADSVSGYVASDWIYIKGISKLTKNKNGQSALYDINKEFIEGIGQGLPLPVVIDVPSHATWIRVSALEAELDAFQLESGGSETEYAPYSESLIGEIVYKDNFNTSLKKEYNQIMKQVIDVPAYNLINTGFDFEMGKYYDANGVLQSGGPYANLEIQQVYGEQFYIENESDFYFRIRYFTSGGIVTELGASNTFIDILPGTTRIALVILTGSTSAELTVPDGFDFAVYMRRESNKNITVQEQISEINVKLKDFSVNPETKKEVKVLFLGNSFSDDTLSHVEKIAIDSGVGGIFANLYRGGASLETQWNAIENNINATYKKKVVKNGIYEYITDTRSSLSALNDEDWDYVFLNQVSSQSGLQDAYEPYLSDLIDYIKDKNPDASIGLQVTWAYSSDFTREDFSNFDYDQLTMYQAIIDANLNAFKVNDIDIILPNGTAIQNARSHPDLLSLDRELTEDGYHLATRSGDYLASLTFCELLLEIDTYKVKYKPSNLTNYQSFLMKVVAKNALINPFKVSDILS